MQTLQAARFVIIEYRIYLLLVVFQIIAEKCRVPGGRLIAVHPYPRRMVPPADQYWKVASPRHLFVGGGGYTMIGALK